MSDIMIEAETRLKGMIADIGETTGKQHPTLNDGVQLLKNYANFKNIIQESIYANHSRNDNYDRLDTFAGTSVKDVSMFDFSKVVKFNSAFSECHELESLVINISATTTMQSFCLQCKNLKSVNLIGMTDKVVYVSQAFYYCLNVEEIKLLNTAGVANFGTGTSNYTFRRCDNLKKILFVPECIKVSFWIADSPLLSNESKQSIFDGLAIVTTAQTVTFHKDVKILQSQVDSANAKGWNVAGGTVVSEEEYYG